MKRFLTALAALLAVLSAAGQEKTMPEQSGFSFAGFPMLGYDADNGLRLGLATNVYDFGKSGYPNPRQQVFAEASWSLKGSQAYVLGYDNRFLIPGIRFTFAAQYADDKAFDFYGFNGYQSYYDAGLPSSYYRISRKHPAAKLDFTGKIAGNLYWKFGYHFHYFIIDEYQNENLQEVPYGVTLFEWYKKMGFIASDEFSGGMTSAWRGGLCYDSRDAEAMPSRGIWADAFMEWAPKWMGTNKPYGRWYFVWRNYLPIASDKLVFAYRADVQGFIGSPAFYVLSFDPVLGPGYDREGYGGYNTVRGLMRNRVQGKTVCSFNTELRWRFLDREVLGQHLAFGANAFFEGARVLQDYGDVSVNGTVWSGPIAEGRFPAQLTRGTAERFHLTAGAGLRVILNKNFIIAVDYGRAFNRQDNGKGGALYFNTGFLF